jgi:hypothetical protein
MSLFTNRFEVSIAEDTVLHEFQVIGIPEGRSKRMMKMFVDTAIQKSPILNNNRDFFAADNTKSKQRVSPRPTVGILLMWMTATID